MPEPEADWIDTPPARHWVIRYRYVGVHSGHFFDDADACFASDGICRRIFSRYPTDYAFHYRPLTKSDTEPLCADRDTDDPLGIGSHPDASTDTHPEPVRGDVAGGAGDSDRSSHADQLRADNPGAGGGDGVLLDGGPAHAESDADAATVRDACAGDALPEGGIDEVS